MAKAIWVTALLAVCVCACSAGTTGSGTTTTGASAGGGSETPRLVVSGKTFTRPQDLSRLLEPDKKGQRPQVLELDHCTFQGRVSFGPLEQAAGVFGAGVTFRECTFEDEFDARQVQFLSSVSLQKCRFKKRIILQAASFLGSFAARECAIDGDAELQNALFLREANFMDCHFFGYALLQEVRFMSKALFGNAIFHKNADFTLVRFMDGAQFDYGKFLQRADFTGCRIEGAMGLNQVQAQQVSLKQAVVLAPVSMVKMTLKDSTLTDGAFFLLGPPKR